MAYNFLNGYGSPKMVIQHIDNKTNDITIELDMCMLEGGLMENYNEDFKRIKLENGKIEDYDFKGSNIKFDLDYNFCTAENLYKIDLINYYNSLPELYKMFFSPRTLRASGRVFEVRCSGDEFSQGVETGGTEAPGHRNVKVSYITTYPGGKQFAYTDDSVQRSYYYRI